MCSREGKKGGGGGGRSRRKPLQVEATPGGSSRRGRRGCSPIRSERATESRRRRKEREGDEDVWMSRERRKPTAFPTLSNPEHFFQRFDRHKERTR
jgi:hypothetical protein